MKRKSHGGSRPLSKQRLRLWIRLLRTTRYLEAEVRERLRCEFGTTLPRFDVLAGLYRSEGGLTMTHLSRALMVSNGNVTGIVERLVLDGLIVRVPIENDRRATRVSLTERGRKKFAEMAAAHEDWINELLGSLGRDDADELLDLVGQVAPHQGWH
ncbi:MAG: MarR family transcriptional regulator [Hyphomicrobiales bacterium]|nr:MarR family transcriptional regulator [Hyphomicrobiales bacterium]